MNIDKAIKSSIEYDINEKSKSTSPEVFDRILDSVYSQKEVKKNNRHFNRFKKIHYLAATMSFLLIFSSFLYFTFFYSNHDVSSDGSAAKSALLSDVKFYNDNYYIRTGQNVKDEKVKILIGDNVYEIIGVSPLKEIAVFESGNYIMYKASTFTEDQAINMIAQTLFYDFNIRFPERVGVCKNVINIKGRQIPIEVESKAEKSGKYKYVVTCTQKWNSADYNKDGENGLILKHYWKYSIDPFRSNLIEEGGSKYPQMELNLDTQNADYKVFPTHVIWKDRFYFITDRKISKNEISKSIGQTIDLSSLYQIKGASVSKRIAILFDTYYVCEVASFDKNDAVHSLLQYQYTKEVLGNISFPDKEGVNTVSISGKTISLELKTKVTKVEGYKYIVTFTETWEPKRQHYWKFEVTPNMIKLIKNTGDHLPQ